MDDKERKKFERIQLGDISFEEIINLIIEKKIDEIEKKSAHTGSLLLTLQILCPFHIY